MHPGDSFERFSLSTLTQSALLPLLRGGGALASVWAKRSSVWAKRQQIDGLTLSFQTFGMSIGRPMRRLKQACKESALKPSNPSVVATGRLPPATPCGPGVLTVCCRSPHAGGGQSCDNPYSKMTMPTLFGGPTAPLYDCGSRTQRKQDGPRLLLIRQCGPPELTGGSSRAWGSTFGSQDARGYQTLGALCIT